MQIHSILDGQDSRKQHKMNSNLHVVNIKASLMFVSYLSLSSIGLAL